METTFIALFTFVQNGTLHSNTRLIKARTWAKAIAIAEEQVYTSLDVMKDSGVTEVQLQSLTFTNH
jgi:hypothetical protein